MKPTNAPWSTGLPGLDDLLKGLQPGDNVVWQVPSIEAYEALTAPFVGAGRRAGRPVVYFRFASHPPLLADGDGIAVHTLRPEEGFEHFIAHIHRIIAAAGRGALYVFDSLSELAADWYSDQMLGNFFMLTCPYLYELETVAYFALWHNRHARHALDPILATTQLFIEVYGRGERLFMRPLKVRRRHSAAMHTLHAWLPGDRFQPVTLSPVVADVLRDAAWPGIGFRQAPDYRERALAEAGRALASGEEPGIREACRRLCRMHVSRDERILPLVERYLELADLVDIGKRMIGSGLIGGKAVGMLLARAILRRNNPRLAALLETPDSFYVGSDVFYTFLVRNKVWWARERQRDPERFLDGAEEARRHILAGSFPETILDQFEEMLDYFGQAPFIVRSSSLLEDNFGNAFSGKYESVFCANQGTRAQRLEDFLAAVRTVYASTMSEKALRYRAQRGLLEHDEQMALLVMRVSGSLHGVRFYPALAGVGFSFNPYAWSEYIDPEAGVLRLVFGLGTRAVDRSDDDYTRIIALNAPLRRPETHFDEVRQFAQRRVDWLDLEANALVSGSFSELLEDAGDAPLRLFAESGGDDPRRKADVLTFNGLLRETPFVTDLRALLATLQEAYGCPVDIEFTANFIEEQAYRVHLVQCRPLQVRGGPDPAEQEPAGQRGEILIAARGAVIGRSRSLSLRHLVQVVPEPYARLSVRDQHEVARLIGELNRVLPAGEEAGFLLMGPGRWGTRMPSMGVPVTFAEIDRAAVLVEVVALREDFLPDASLGTHFLNDLIETDMLYVALFPGESNHGMDAAFLEQAPNRLADIAPAHAGYAPVVRVIDAGRPAAPSGRFRLTADALKQRLTVFRPAGGGG